MWQEKSEQPPEKKVEDDAVKDAWDAESSEEEPEPEKPEPAPIAPVTPVKDAKKRMKKLKRYLIKLNKYFEYQELCSKQIIGKYVWNTCLVIEIPLFLL